MIHSRQHALRFVRCTKARRRVHPRCAKHVDFTLDFSQVADMPRVCMLARNLSKNWYETWTRPGCGVRVRRCSAIPGHSGAVLRLARLGGRYERCEHGSTHHRARCARYLRVRYDGCRKRVPAPAGDFRSGGTTTVALRRAVADVAWVRKA